MEVIAVQSCFNQLIAQPRVHRVDITIEILIHGNTLDESLVIFIRRVLEEAHYSNISPNILSSHLLVAVDPTDLTNVQEIDIRTMKTKRHQILTLLNTAVANGGEIFLEFYIRTRRVLPAFAGVSDSGLYREETEGLLLLFFY